MKKAFGILFIAFFSVINSHGQTRQERYERQIRQLKTVGMDTNRVNLMIRLAAHHTFARPDSGIYYASQALALARNLQFPPGETQALFFMGFSYESLGDYPKALRIHLEVIRLIRQYQLFSSEGRVLGHLGGIYLRNGAPRKAIGIFLKVLDMGKGRLGNNMVTSESALAVAYAQLHLADTAYMYLNRARNHAIEIGATYIFRIVYEDISKAFATLNQLDSALYYARKSYQSSLDQFAGELEIPAEPSFIMASRFHDLGNTDSAEFYSKLCLAIAQKSKQYEWAAKASRLVTQLPIDKDSTSYYSNLAFAYRDSLDQIHDLSSFQTAIDFDEQQREYELDLAEKTYESQLRTNVFIGSTLLLLIIVFFAYRNSRQKHRAKQQIEKAYDQLKSTQSQLIQSEKMASLGELTAGIAHEIQNPLNFVNNFSEVSSELIREMKTELATGNLQLATELADSIDQNLDKIVHHGNRADIIVKSMMQHSRGSSAQKVETDINQLCDEYLRLAYHGYRAKDKSFNAKFETEFDESIPKLKVVPQDIGRVVLNLINNAFYAVHVKMQDIASQGQQQYDALVTVSTKNLGDKVEIHVKDNGNGIPDSVKDKIFQPFFTTKPTGQGTGLGLSLSYDIVKAHGGEIEVRTLHSEGCEFLIILPVGSGQY